MSNMKKRLITDLEEDGGTVKYLCKKLGIDFSKVRIIENTDFGNIIFKYSGKPLGFHLSIGIYEKQKEVDLIIYDIDSPISKDFMIIESGARNFNQRWIDKCLSDLEKEKGTLNYYVDKYRHQIGSEYGVPQNGAFSFKRDLRGLISINSENVIHVLKIKHIREEDNYRALSYGIYDFQIGKWIIYPYCGSLDSGGGGGCETDISCEIEGAKRKKVKIRLIELVIELEIFKNFFGLENDEITQQFVDLRETSIYKPDIEELIKLIELRNFIKALSEMRTLIFSMSKKIIHKNNLDFKPKENKIGLVLKYLCEKKILDNSIIPFNGSFSIMANHASHNKEDIFWQEFPNVKNREELLISALHSGKILIKELDSIIRPENKIEDCASFE